MQESSRETDRYPKWGFTSAVTNDWELQGWTLGAHYEPGQSIRMAVRLIYRGKTEDTLSKCHLNIRVIGPTDKPEETSVEITPLFEKIANDPATWEAIIENPFPRQDISYGSKKFAEGDYLLRIHARLNNTIDFSLKDIRFKVQYFRK